MIKTIISLSILGFFLIVVAFIFTVKIQNIDKKIKNKQGEVDKNRFLLIGQNMNLEEYRTHYLSHQLNAISAQLSVIAKQDSAMNSYLQKILGELELAVKNESIITGGEYHTEVEKKLNEIQTSKIEFPEKFKKLDELRIEAQQRAASALTNIMQDIKKNDEEAKELSSVKDKLYLWFSIFQVAGLVLLALSQIFNLMYTNIKPLCPTP